MRSDAGFELVWCAVVCTRGVEIERESGERDGREQQQALGGYLSSL